MKPSLIILATLTNAFLKHSANAAPTAADLAFTEVSDGHVFTMTTQKDGKVIILGDFKSVAGVPRSGIARLNADGTLDAGFNPDARARVEGDPVFTLPLSDRKLLVCGWNQMIKAQSFG